MRKPYWTTAWEWTDEQDPYCANCGYPFDRHERVIGDLECEFCFCSEKCNKEYNRMEAIKMINNLNEAAKKELNKSKNTY